ncbi:hypothetical protein STENM327S_05805 [Streptomyces tendae]
MRAVRRFPTARGALGRLATGRALRCADGSGRRAGHARWTTEVGLETGAAGRTPAAGPAGPADARLEVAEVSGEPSLLRTLHEPENSDDVALLIARATPPVR